MLGSGPLDGCRAIGSTAYQTRVQPIKHRHIPKVRTNFEDTNRFVKGEGA